MARSDPQEKRAAGTAYTASHDHPQARCTVEQDQHNTSKAHLLDHLQASVKANVMVELELLLLTIATGMQDATTFPDYHCFASNQTGNTVLLALSVTVPGLAGDLFVPNNIGVSLGMFLAGGFITGQVSHHFVSPRSRWWLLLCNTMQTLAVFGAAAIQFAHGTQKDEIWALGVLACLAFASGSQVVLSRTFGMTEISTAMATAAWVDLVIDARVFRIKNDGRNRRSMFLVALVAGSFIGAGVFRTLGSAWVILLSGVCKLFVAILFLFNPSERVGVCVTEP